MIGTTAKALAGLAAGGALLWASTPLGGESNAAFGTDGPAWLAHAPGLIGMLAGGLALGWALSARRQAVAADRQLQQVSAALERLAALALLDRDAAPAAGAATRDDEAGKSGAPAVTASATAENVVPLRPHRQETADPDPRLWSEPVRERLVEGRLDICLEPIISLSTGSVVAFEAHAHLRHKGRAGRFRRLGDMDGRVDTAAFEFHMVKAALGAARRHVGGRSAGVPVHAAISDAILASPQWLERLCGLIASDPAFGNSLTLSFPARLLDDAAGAAALGRLAAIPVRLAAEGWHPSFDGQDEAGPRFPAGLESIKLDATALRGAAADGGRSGLSLIATGVENEEAAAELAEAGIDRMCGSFFSTPHTLSFDDEPPSPRMTANVAEDG